MTSDISGLTWGKLLCVSKARRRSGRKKIQDDFQVLLEQHYDCWSASHSSSNSVLIILTVPTVRSLDNLHFVSLVNEIDARSMMERPKVPDENTEIIPE